MNHISFTGPLVSCSFKNLRRFLSASLTLSLSFVLLSGCGSSVQPLIVSSPDQPITLNVCVWEDEKTYMTAVADAYNAVSANVTVQITPCMMIPEAKSTFSFLFDSVVKYIQILWDFLLSPVALTTS